MQHLKSGLSVSCAQLSQAGIKDVNEDSIGIRIPESSALTHKGIVGVIADGVSAAEAGREASQACVQNLLYDYYCTPDTWTVKKSILSVLNALNRWLYSQGSHLPDTSKGFITTLSLVIFKSSTAYLFHIGDSRIYRYRQGELEQLTHDHARKVGKTSYLARAMGLDNKIQVDFRTEQLRPGDIYILTTDGIHDFLPSNDWPPVLEESIDLDEAVRKLHEGALACGSNDNLSCQMLRIDSIGETSANEAYQELSDLPFPPPLETGQILDGLKVLDTLHASNRSQLYLVQAVDTGEVMVMKTPSVNFQDDAAYIERFIMESWLGRRLRHSKVIKVRNPPDDPTCLYYLMDQAEGITLQEWIEQTSHPSVTQVVRIARQIIHGLRAFHRQQVVHQDIKPANIVIDDNEQVTLIDFGSCSVSSMQELPEPFERDIALGTASYSAPECHLRQPIDARADQFSLAVILYEMLTGSLPYGNALEAVEKPEDLKKLRYIPAAQRSPNVPDWFDATLAKALSIDPNHRYQDLDEFLYDMEHPNDKLITRRHQPLIARNPSRFWQGVALVELAIIVALLLTT